MKDGVRDDHLGAPPDKKTHAQLRIRYGKLSTNGTWSNLHAPRQSQSTASKTSPSPIPALSTHPTSPLVSTTTSIDLTGHDNYTKTQDGTGTQDTLDSMISSLQCTFHQEVETINTLQREAAKANAKSLLDIQTVMNTKQTEIDRKLVVMDQTIRTVHEGQKLNDENMQLLMKQFTVFGAQMQMMQNLQPTKHLIAIETPVEATETPVTANETVPGANNLEASPTGDTGLPPLDLYSAPEMNVAEFDTIMSDAETRKRLAEEKDADAFSKRKKLRISLH